MRTKTARTPVWFKALLIVIVGGPPAWWLADRLDRAGNERRLTAIASDIAGRQVEVHCPGPLKRIGPDLRGGYVPWEADGTTRETFLSTATCAELDALAEGDRKDELACVERSTSCGDDVQAVAWAVNTVTHEAFHLRGYLNEGVTECYSMQTMARTAQRLGATPAQAQGLAVLYFETTTPDKHPDYKAPGCADGEALDLRPGDPVWP